MSSASSVVRAAAMARVNWSVNIESAFRAVTRRRAVDSGKAGARRKKALASIQIFGEIAVVRRAFSPALPDTGPPSTAGFVFLDCVNLHGRPHAGEFVSWP
jgi:hypothetical protein